jgi:DNA excision repair protein ERCC-2
MGHLEDVRETAHQRAEPADEFAVCCSDGDFVFASTRAQAEDTLDEMKSARNSLNPHIEYEYDVLDLSDYDAEPPQQRNVSAAAATTTTSKDDAGSTTSVSNTDNNRTDSAAALAKGAPDQSRQAPTSSAADWRALFPYEEPREAQVDGIESVIENASDRGYTLLEGACGTGKTLVGLCAGLELVRDPDSSYERLLCLTSVKQQIRAFEDDLRAINHGLRDQIDDNNDREEENTEVTPEPVSALTLVGKGDVCSYTNTGRIDQRSIYGRCEDLREPVRRTAMYADDGERALRELANDATVESSPSDEPVATNQWEAPYAQQFPETDENDTDYCPFYAKYRHDTYGQDDDGYTPQGMVTPDDLVTQASTDGICPHAAMSDALGNAEVVVANYYHAFDPTTVTAMTGSLIDEQTLVVCDEAHMLVPKVRGLLSDHITRSAISSAITEIQNRVLDQGRQGIDQVFREVLAEEGVSRDTLRSVVEFLQEAEHYLEKKAPDILDEEEPGWRGTDMEDLPETVEDGLREPHTPERDGFSEWMASCGHAATMEKAGPVGQAVARALREASNRYPSFECPQTYADTVGEVFTRWAECDHEQYFRSIELHRRQRYDPSQEQDWNQQFTVRFQMHNCLPSAEIAERFDQFGGGLLMSATLEPLDVYRRSVGLDQLDAEGRPVQELTYGLPFPEENRESAAVNLSKFTYNNRGGTEQRWRNRDQDVVRDQYLDVAQSVIETTPGNVMVAMPSYSEGKWLAGELRTSQNVDREVLIDESSADEVTDDLKSEFFAGSPKVLVTSILGTLTEGVDYEGDRLAACVVCGVPIQNTNGLVPTAVETAYKREFGNDVGFDFAFTVPAVRKARQALGRVIRGHEEAGVRVAVDRRYASDNEWDDVREYLPQYERDDYAPTSSENLGQQLESFWLNV